MDLACGPRLHAIFATNAEAAVEIDAVGDALPDFAVHVLSEKRVVLAKTRVHEAEPVGGGGCEIAIEGGEEARDDLRAIRRSRCME